MKIKYLIIILIILGSAVISYFYSGTIYKTHLKVYHKHIKRQTSDNMLENAVNKYKMKEYRESLKVLNIAENVYGSSPEIKKLQGLNNIRLGNDKYGADLIIESLPGGDVKPAVLKEAIGILYKHGFYGDIVGAAENYRNFNDHIIKYYYGISLYRVSKYSQCIDQLREALRLGENRYTRSQEVLIHLYIGLSFEGLNRFESGVKHVMAARKLDSRNREVNESLVRLFRKMGKLERAERIIRRQ